MDKEFYIKKIEELKEILKGKFADKSDREYCEKKLKEYQSYLSSSESNEKLFRHYKKKFGENELAQNPLIGY